VEFLDKNLSFSKQLR